MSRITVITGQYDQIIDAPIYDEAGRPVSFTEDAAGVSFIVYTPDTPKESRLVLPPSRYRDGRIYIDAAELQSLTAGELFMTVELSAGYDGYTDGTFDTGYTVQLRKYLKTDNPPRSTYDRIADLNKDIDELRLDASYNEDVHGELRAMDASLADAITALRRGQDGLERAVADVSASIPEIPEIPDKVSQLVNDSSFVDKDRVDGIDLRLHAAEDAVQALDASVKDVYTREEVNQMISGLTSLDMEIVDELPAEPDRHTIYLLEEDGLYGQYFYNTKVNDYVRISDTAVDLSAYITKAEAARTYAAESGMAARIQNAVSTGVYTAEAVAAEMDASVLAASKAYTDASLSLLRGDVSLLESEVDGISTAVSGISGIESRLGALEASVGDIQPAGPSFRKITVQSLPAAAEADENALYFLQSSSEANNVYTEYTIVDGAWEIVGWAVSASDGPVDLSGLVNEAQLGLAVSEVNARMDAADSSLKNYVDGLVNGIDASVDLTGYATEQYVDSAFGALDASVKNVYTKAEVDQKIVEAGQGGEVSLDGYARTEDVSAADAALAGIIGDVSAFAHAIVIPEGADVSKGYVDAQDASIVDWIDASVTAGLDLILSGEAVVRGYDDTEVRGLIADVSAYAHGQVIPEIPAGIVTDASFVVNPHGPNWYVTGDDGSVPTEIRIGLGIQDDGDGMGYEAQIQKELLHIQAGPGIIINTVPETADSSISVDASLFATRQFVAENAYNDASVKADIQDVSSYAHGLVIPEIPQNVSAFTNDVGYLTEHQSLAGLATDASLQELAASIPEVESYDDSSLSQAIEDVSTFAHSIEIPEAYDDTSLTQAVDDVSTYAHGLDIPAAYDDTEIRALIADVSTFSHNLRSGSPFQVVSSLPSPSDADESLIYLYPDAAGNNNVYTEYVVVNGQWEIIGQGTLDINLAEYAKDASLQAATVEINDVSASLAATAAELADVSTYVHSLAIPEAYDDTSVTNRLNAHDTSIGGLDASVAGFDASLVELAAKLDDVSAAVDDVSYNLPVATSAAIGGIKIGYTQNDAAQFYPVLLDQYNTAYVHIPWVAGSGVSESDVSSMISAALSAGNYLTSSSLTGLASESYVQNYVSNAVTNAGFLTSHQTLKTINGYSLVGSGNIEVTPNLNGYATQTWVTQQITSAGGGVTDASVRSLVDAYDTSMQTYVQGAVSGVTGGGLSDSSVRSIIESYGYMQAASYADIARQSWVEQRIVDLTSGGTVDLSAYASKTYVDTSIQSVKTWVGQQGYLTSHQSLSNYVTKSALDASYAALDASIKAGGGVRIVNCTQAQYNQMSSHDSNTLYVITAN